MVAWAVSNAATGRGPAVADMAASPSRASFRIPQQTPIGHPAFMPIVSPKPVFIVDGSRFDDFEGFTREVSRLVSDYTWHGSLDALDDVLRGGVGTPEGGFILRWVHSDRSRAVLGYDATTKRLQELLASCHPSNRVDIAHRLADARTGKGPTLFDEIVEIVERHGPDGEEPESGVDLELL
jgi:RNAse (barnase) inhibitor barstar